MAVVRSPPCVAHAVWHAAVPGPGTADGAYGLGTFQAYAHTSNWTFIHGRFTGVLVDKNLNFMSSQAYNAVYGEGKLEAVFERVQTLCMLQDSSNWREVVATDAAEAAKHVASQRTVPELSSAHAVVLLLVCMFLWRSYTHWRGPRTSA